MYQLRSQTETKNKIDTNGKFASMYSGSLICRILLRLYRPSLGPIRIYVEWKAAVPQLPLSDSALTLCDIFQQLKNALACFQFAIFSTINILTLHFKRITVIFFKVIYIYTCKHSSQSCAFVWPKSAEFYRYSQLPAD